MPLPFRHDLSAARPPAAFAALRAKAAAAAARHLAQPSRDAAPILALAEARDDLPALRRRAEARKEKGPSQMRRPKS